MKTVSCDVTAHARGPAHEARGVVWNWKKSVMAAVLQRLVTKKEVDSAIKSTVDKVLVLRFGKETDGVCMQLDNIVSVILTIWEIFTYEIV